MARPSDHKREFEHSKYTELQKQLLRVEILLKNLEDINRDYKKNRKEYKRQIKDFKNQLRKYELKIDKGMRGL